MAQRKLLPQLLATRTEQLPAQSEMKTMNLLTSTQKYSKIGDMEEEMTSKEFDLLITLIIKMLEDGKTQDVIDMLKEAKESH